MARKPRIHFRGAVYHVILTGLNTQTIFKTVSDRKTWLTLVQDGVDRFGHQVHGYCLEREFVQMAIEVDDTPLSKIMQNLSFRYTRYFNSARNREGALFHGRYKAIVVDADTYLTDLVRHIHNTPVRSGKAADAAAAKWTSHHAYLDPDQSPAWLTTSRVLSEFSGSDKKSRTAFGKFVKAGMKEGESVDFTKGSHEGRIIGDKRFARKALKPVKPVVAPVTLDHLVKRVCQHEGLREAHITDHSRARRGSRIRQAITYLAIEMNVATLSDMSQRFNRDLTTMSRNQRYFREKLAEDADLQKYVRSLKRTSLKG
ncbi:MAG: transposase [Granulosicoccus sp.]